MPEDFEPQWRPTVGPMPAMPPPGRVPQLIEPTNSALRWDAAVNRGCVPLRAPSVSSAGRSGAASLPGMPPVSISSSADRRRELLQERHEELQAQLKLVEDMLKQAAPSTMLSTMSGFSAVSKKSAKSTASARSARSAASSSGGVVPLAAPAATALLEAVPEESYVKPPPVPLMVDPNTVAYTVNSPFRSGAGTGLALPGQKLSAVGKLGA
ncbi:hypothetical protein OAO87_04830 [bacterium]|nr:hypothetical protein [bacterium]